LLQRRHCRGNILKLIQETAWFNAVEDGLDLTFPNSPIISLMRRDHEMANTIVAHDAPTPRHPTDFQVYLMIDRSNLDPVAYQEIIQQPECVICRSIASR